MQTVKIFLASSSELKVDRDQFEIAICRKNKEWVKRGVFLDLVLWENFLDRVSQTRLQDEYNKEIRNCDLFVMLFRSKVGKYTSEEFKTAFKQFKSTQKPFIFTYFKDMPVDQVVPDDLASLLAFQQKLKDLGHFQTAYTNIEGLLLHFNQQLEKLAANGFIEFERDDTPAPSGTTSYQATLNGSGAITHGDGAVAVGSGGVHVGGKNTGNINTGNINTGGAAYVADNVTVNNGHFIGRDYNSHGISSADLEAVFATLRTTVKEFASAAAYPGAIQQVEALKTEAAKGKQADDGKIATIIEGLVSKVPNAVATVVSMFATPILAGIAGPVTKYVLSKLNKD